jgi:methionyl-tRNA formyltransferase
MIKLNFSVLFAGKKNDKFSQFFFSILKKNFSNVNQFSRNKIIKKKIDFLISFRSKFIFKKKHLSKARYCINFHPGPPKYRGIGCVNFSILNKEKLYGVTMHLIDERIDHGKIIDVVYFKINKKYNIEKILKLSYINQIRQLRLLIKKIKNNKDDLHLFFNKKNKYYWSKKLYTKKDLEKLYKVNKNISKKRLELLLKSTVIKGYVPYIKIYNHNFFYEKK